MSASKHRLSNLVWMIDYNKLQSYGLTSEVLDLEPLGDKLQSFGFNVQNIDGHQLGQIEQALLNTKTQTKKPNAIICNTIKGKGFPFAEQNPHWHHKAKLSAEDIQLMYKCVSEKTKNAQN